MQRSRKIVGRRALSGILVVISIAIGMLSYGSEPVSAATVIEDKYKAAGWAASGVTYSDGSPNGCADFGQSGATGPTQPYTYVYPDLSLTPVVGPYKVIVWGNGTIPIWSADTTCYYQGVLRHLAGHGYFVIAPNQGETGSGVAMRGAITQAQTLNTTAGPFQGKLDVTKIMVAGHSQGTIGAFQARIDTQASQPALVDSILAVSTPSNAWINYFDRDDNTICEFYTGRLACTATAGKVGPHMPSKAEMNALGVPVFFARGTGFWEGVVADPTDFPTTRYPLGRFIAGSRQGTDPNNRPDHGNILEPTFAHNALGYVTAWTHFTLNNGNPSVADAATAFAGTAAQREISGNVNWTGINGCIQANLTGC